jgi:inner membrane protein
MPLSPVYVWATIGVILIIVDLVTLTFFLFFLGIGALVTALCTWTGIISGIDGQLICFAVSSLVTMVLFRRLVKKMFGKHQGAGEYSQLVGQKAYVSLAIPAGHEGKVSYRGSDWIAFSDNPHGIPAGALVTIEAVDGIKLKVRTDRGPEVGTEAE